MSGSRTARTWRAIARALLAIACLVASSHATAAHAAEPGWRDEFRAALAAHDAHDLRAYRAHLDKLERLLGPTAGISYQLARAEALAGHRQAAFAHLADYAASGLVRAVAADSDFIGYSADSGFQALAKRVRRNAGACGVDTLVHGFGDPGALVEDVARDDVTGHTFVAMVRRGGVLELDAAGNEHPVAGLVPAGWGAFAVRIDAARRRLWVAVAATPTSDGFAAADSGRTALIAWDLGKGRQLTRLEPPRDRPRVLGDMTLGPDGAVYASDGLAGSMFVVRPGRESLDVLVPDGTLDSPQTPAFDRARRRLYVPEYSRGIAVVDARTGAVSRLAGGPALFLSGIDGLYLDGVSLIAVQNGANPERLVRFDLDASGGRVMGWDCLVQASPGLGDPTHGMILGRNLVFIANSGWDRVGDDQRMRAAPAGAPAELRRVGLGAVPPGPLARPRSAR